jgi:hypothetical protein
MDEVTVANCTAGLSPEDDLWGTLTGSLWYSFLIIPSVSLLCDFYMIGVCLVQPICSAQARTRDDAPKTFAYQLGAMAVADVLMDAVFIFMIYLRHRNPCNVESPHICRPVYYTYMAAQFSFWMFGVNIAMNALLQVAHYTNLRKFLFRFQYFTWVIAFAIPIQVFQVKEWVPHKESLFCLPAVHDDAAYRFILTMGSLVLLVGLLILAAFGAAHNIASQNSTASVEAKQTERLQWAVTMILVVYMPTLASGAYFLRRKEVPQWLCIWWACANFAQGSVNCLLCLNSSSSSSRFTDTNHVAFEPTDSIFTYWYRNMSRSISSSDGSMDSLMRSTIITRDILSTSVTLDEDILNTSLSEQDILNPSATPGACIKNC